MAYDDNAAYEQGVPCSQQQQLPPDAPCVFYFHGLMSSRLERHPAAGPFGVRIITIDRPGQGMSDHCHYTYEDFSGFVCELADIIGIRKFGVVGFSSGGPYALAMAYVICLSSLLLFSSKFTHSLLLQLLSSCPLDRLLHYWRRSSPRFPGVFQNRRVQRGAGHHVPRKVPRFDPAYLFHFSFLIFMRSTGSSNTIAMRAALGAFVATTTLTPQVRCLRFGAFSLARNLMQPVHCRTASTM